MFLNSNLILSYLRKNPFPPKKEKKPMVKKHMEKKPTEKIQI